MSDNKKPILDSQAYITIGYLTVVIIGMMFDVNYYYRLLINILEYDDVLEFILAYVQIVQFMIFDFDLFLERKAIAIKYSKNPIHRQTKLS